MLNKLRIIVGLISAISIFGAANVSAQDETEQSTTGEERVLDTVTVTGVQNDAAMAAFQAGDYATAEVEFLDNAMCALRRERNLTASIENARISADRADTFANSTGGDSGASSQGATAGGATDIPTGIASPTGVAARNVQTDFDRTCEMRGRQLYFAGLSQIQLGKTDEALRSLERATAASKVLYDAHYKIGLIKILEGDRKSAERELSRIERILTRCRNCEARQEIEQRRDHLSRAIAGEVSLR